MNVQTGFQPALKGRKGRFVIGGVPGDPPDSPEDSAGVYVLRRVSQHSHRSLQEFVACSGAVPLPPHPELVRMLSDGGTERSLMRFPHELGEVAGPGPVITITNVTWKIWRDSCCLLFWHGGNQRSKEAWWLWHHKLFLYHPPGSWWLLYVGSYSIQINWHLYKLWGHNWQTLYNQEEWKNLTWFKWRIGDYLYCSAIQLWATEHKWKKTPE